MDDLDFSSLKPLDPAPDEGGLDFSSLKPLDQPSMAGAAARGAERGILPSIAGMAGMGAGAEAGAALGLLGGPAAPVTVPIGGLLGGLAGGFLAGAGAGAVQDKAIEALPEGWQQAIGQDKATQQADVAAHPYAAMAGEVGSGLLTMRPGAAAAAIRPGATAVEKILANPYAARAAGATLAGGQEAGQEYAQTGQVDPAKLAIAASAGALMNKETRLGHAVSDVGGAPIRAVTDRFRPPETAAAMTGNDQAAADQAADAVAADMGAPPAPDAAAAPDVPPPPPPGEGGATFQPSLDIRDGTYGVTSNGEWVQTGFRNIADAEAAAATEQAKHDAGKQVDQAQAIVGKDSIPDDSHPTEPAPVPTPEPPDPVPAPTVEPAPEPAVLPPPARQDGPYAMVDPQDLKLDPKRFQYKASDENGVTGALTGVNRWEPELADPITAWQAKDGQLYVVNGHQRTDLALRAQEAGQPDVQVPARIYKETDGHTPAQMLQLGAFQNIAQGTGTAIDAAKILRNPMALPPDRRMPDLPPKSQLVQDATGLAKLGDDAFGMVVNDVVPPAYAAHVGHAIADPIEQVAALDLLAKADPANSQQARFMVNDIKNSGFLTATQDSLFGPQTSANSLFPERAKVIDNSLRLLRKMSSTFKTAVEQEDTLTKAGNTLSRDANIQGRVDNARLIARIDADATRKGPVSDALSGAARDLQSGKPAPRVYADFISAVRKIESEPAAQLGVRPGDPGSRAEPPSQVQTQPVVRPPAVEKTAQGDQLVMPGAERSAVQAAAARGETMRAPVAQQPADAGMFAKPEPEQPSLLNQPAPKPEIPKGKPGEITPATDDFAHYVQDQTAGAGIKTPEQASSLAGQYVLDRGRATKKEWGVLYDDATGQNLQATTSNMKDKVFLPSDMVRQIMDPNSNLVFHHNHPKDAGLSGPDLGTLWFRGLSWMVAHGHDGYYSAARLGQNMAGVVKSKTQDRFNTSMEKVHRATATAVAYTLVDEVRARNITFDDGANAETELVNNILDKLGIIEHDGDRPIPGIPQDLLNKAVKAGIEAAQKQAKIERFPFKDAVDDLSIPRSAAESRPTRGMAGIPRFVSEAAARPEVGPAGAASHQVGEAGAAPEQGVQGEAGRSGNPNETQGTFLESERELEKALPFYSALQRGIEGIKQDTAPAQQWKNVIQNLAAKGVKQEEINWTGVKEWLDEQKGSVSKADLLQHIAENNVQMKDVMLGDDPAVDAWRSRDEMVPDEQAIKDHGPAWDALTPKLQEAFEGSYGWSDPGKRAEWQRVEQELRAQQDALHARMIDESMERQGPKPERTMQKPQYKSYTTPGGENYREMLMSMPRREVTTDDVAQRLFDKPMRNLTEDERSRVSDEMRAMSDNGQKDFKSGHWDEPNVLAHIRMDDRTGPNGEKILHVQEIQSDWHQKGRKEGYQSDNPESVYRIRNRSSGNTSEWYNTPEEAHAAREALPENIRAMTVVDKKDMPQKGVPNAPFKSSWHELAMKRVLRHAAENGYDKVTWDTGETQADRYDLSKHLDNVSVVRMNDAGDRMWWPTTKTGEQIGGIKTDSTGKILTANKEAWGDIEGQNISDALGKDLAEKGLSSDQRETKLSGVDLKVGGEGMKGFYNKILPAFANKYLKKWGARVEPGTIPTTERAGDHYEGPEPTREDVEKVTAISGNGGQGIHESPITGARRTFALNRVAVDHPLRNIAREMDGGMSWADAFATHGTHEIAEIFGGKSEPTTVHDTVPVHSVDITPEMREGVMQGQALFEDDPAIKKMAEKLPEPDRESLEAAVKAAQPSLIKAAQNPRGPLGTPIKAVETLGRVVNDSMLGRFTRRALAPGTFDANAKVAARTIRQAFGQAYVREMGEREALKKGVDMLDTMGADAKKAFAIALDTGDRQATPELQAIADNIKAVTQQSTRRLQTLGVLENAKENYLGRIWKPRGEEVGVDTHDKVLAALASKRPLTGPGSFLKQRYHETYEGAIESGLEPVFDNPIMAHMVKLSEMNRFYAGSLVARAAKQGGMAKFYSGHADVPEGWIQLEGPEFQRQPRTIQHEDGTTSQVQAGAWYAPEGFGRVMNNYISRGLEGTIMGEPVSALRKAANAMNMMQLGLSLFHPVFTSVDAQISRIGIGIDQAMRGQFGKAAGNIIGGISPTNWVSNMKDGNALIQAILHPHDATPEMKRLTEAFGAGGGRIWMEKMLRPTDEGAFKLWKAGAWGSAIRQAALKYPGSPVRGLLNVTGRALESTSAPIMDYLVPRQKVGVFSRLAQDWLQSHPDASNVEFTTQMQDIWETVDNRLGEMVYDNLFWNKTLKDLGFIAVRSVGWNLGSMREIGGGAAEAGKFALDAAAGRTPEWTRRMSYMIALPATTAMYGAMYQYLSTGQGPTELKDYFFPKTGLMRPDGAAERVSMPSYMKDVYAWAHDPLQTAKNKLNPLLSAVSQMLDNKDYRGDIIRNSDDPIVQQVGEVMEFAAKQFAPFSLTSSARMFKEHPGPQAVAGVLGVQPAPGFIANPEREEFFQEKQHHADVKKKMLHERKAANPAPLRPMPQTQN